MHQFEFIIYNRPSIGFSPLAPGFGFVQNQIAGEGGFCVLSELALALACTCTLVVMEWDTQIFKRQSLCHRDI